jgi:type IV pilus assembly protein PilM
VDQEIDTIILSGGCALVTGLDGFLKERLGSNIEVCNPFQSIIVNEKKFDPQYIAKHAPAAAVAVGLALRKAGDK